MKSRDSDDGRDATMIGPQEIQALCSRNGWSQANHKASNERIRSGKMQKDNKVICDMAVCARTWWIRHLYDSISMYMKLNIDSLHALVDLTLQHSDYVSES